MVLSVALLAMLAGWAGGCSWYGSGPSRPKFTPEKSAREALEMYDANGDGQLSGEELAACPALETALDRIDQNGDGALSADEIADRIRYFTSAPTSIVNGSVEIKANGRALEGAQVTFDPEGFLGESFKPCSGTTDRNGRAVMEGADSQFPGLYLGFYKVRVSKEVDGEETIPARYNTETELGYEAADDIPQVSNVIQFDLEIPRR